MHLIVRLCAVLALCRADQVVLLDTTKEQALGWTRYPYGNDAQTPGWIEESYTDFNKNINWRSYVVCDVAYSNVNNWIWTPFIDRGPANMMYIEVKFTIRDCSLFPGNALSCKETFSLLSYEFDAVTREPPPWELDGYKLIGRVAAGEGRFNTNNDVGINTEIKSIAVTKKGVYFALRDQGACISVLSIKVYYITCPAVTINFAKFAETPTGREITVIEQAIGHCVENAEMVDTPVYRCKGDGKWTLLSGGCRCKGGFEPDEERQQCKKCQPGTYRTPDMTKCEVCPPHSYTIQAGSSSCKCSTGYSRASDDPTKPCTHAPSPPNNLTLLYVDKTTIVLTWSEPKPQNQSGRRENELIQYSVKCFGCDRHTVYQPKTRYFTDTNITLSNLQPSTKYKIQISAKVDQKSSDAPAASPTNTSDSLGSMDYAEIVVSTEPNGVSKTADLRVSSITGISAELTWTRGPQDELYEVRWYAQDMRSDAAHNSTSVITKESHVNVNNLHPGTQYAFQIRAKAQGVWSVFTGPVYQRTAMVRGPEHEAVDDVQVRVVAGATVAVVFILVIGIVAAVVYLRSKSSDDLDKNHCPLKLDYTSNEVTMDTAPIVKTIQNNVTTPLFSTNRSYIDPHTYEDPSQAIKEFAREIDASYIAIEAIIGGGEFGDVCRGKMKILPDYVEIDVAIKTLKPGSSDKSRCDFLTEASIMGQFDHPNVIYLQGVVTRSYPVMIITEFMENGSLDTFLRANDGKFQILQLVGMLRGISSGMAYLSDMSYVHRDLAARNVLVNAHLVCKIADFGLSREMENSTEAYTTRGGKIPVRWTAPEAIAFRKFTSASDVWSFGIVLWEVMSYGERPYWNWSNQDVIKSIEKGYRLPAPMECPEALYQLMLDCWQKQRTHRPGFGNITSTLDNLVRCPEALKKLASGIRPAVSQEEDNRSMEAVNDFQNIDQWLTAIKMPQYIGHFHAAGMTSKNHVAHINAMQLRNMGITLIGHQKKIIHRAHQLQNHM